MKEVVIYGLWFYGVAYLILALALLRRVGHEPEPIKTDELDAMTWEWPAR
jgi:hypothetical protein